MMVAVLGGGGWLAVSVFKPAGDASESTLHTVARRSFPVIIESKGELKAKKTTEVKCKVEGRSTIIWLIEEGTTVAEGDLLVRLASDQIDERVQQEEANEASAIAALEAAEKDLEILIDQNLSDIRKSELAVEIAGIELEKYTKGDAVKTLKTNELAIDRVAQSLKRADLEFTAARQLREKGWMTESDYLEKEFALKEAERAVETSNLDLHVFQTYTHPKDLRQRESDVDEAKKELERVRKSALAKEAQRKAEVEAKRAALLNAQNNLKKFREQKEYTEIKAPAPGLVVFDTGNRWDPAKIAEGGEVFEYQTIVSLPDTTVMIVSVRIHEAKTNLITIGQKATIEIEGIPDVIFSGEVSKIAPLADSRNQWLNPDLKEYETEITLETNEHDLKPGVTARSEILVSELKDVVAVPLQAVYSKGGKHYVFKPSGPAAEPIEVNLGESSNDYVEVTSGLDTGERVYLAVSDDAKRLLPEVDSSAAGPMNASAVSSGGTRSVSGSGGAPARRAGGPGRGPAGGSRGGGRRG
ncbi:MAG: efflux RND transporter periplasmic adaptor subunit [Phycisphaerales bacterium]|nr:efflux RND transporter periplasmic adaptor subunit [Phycisphaerales bacterium]